MFFGLHGNVRRPNTGPRQQASDWLEACRGGASAPARPAVLLFWLLSSQLFISVTDLGGCGLDLSPRMRSRRKRAQRAASLLLITAPQTTLLHSHQVACGSLAPRAQRLLRLSILVSERRLPARPHRRPAMPFPFQPSPRNGLASQLTLFTLSRAVGGPFIPSSWIRCYPLQDLAPFLPPPPPPRLVLILCNDIIYPHSHQEMPRFLVAGVHQRIPNDFGWVLLVKDYYYFLSVRLKPEATERGGRGGR